MAGSISSGTISYVPANAVVASATANLPTSTLLTQTNLHIAGSSYRHADSEIDTASVDDSATPTTPLTSATDGHSRFLMLATTLSRIMGGTGSWATRFGAITAGVNDLATVATAVTGATGTATTGLSLMKRDANGATVATGLTMTAYSSGQPPLFVRGFAATNQLLWVGQSGGGSPATTSSVDSAGNAAFSGTGAFTGALTAASFTGTVAVANLSGVVAVANGGTGGASFTQYAVLLGNGASGITGASPAAAGGYLRSAGASANPSFSALLTSDLSGTVAVVNGGTGGNSLTANAVLIGAGVGSVAGASPAAAGTYLRSTGVSANPAFSSLLTSDLSGTVAVANGGTGGATAVAARTALSAAGSGANSDITSLSALSTPLSVAQGGTGATSNAAAQTALGVPGTTGTGASGAWPISVTGSAATATTAGTLTGTNPIANGGTGVTTLTTNGVLIGGASTVGATAAGTTGQYLRGVTGGAPVFVTPLFTDFADQTLPYTKVQDLAIITNTTSLVVGINAGGVTRTDGGGAVVGGGQTLTVAMSASVNQYVPLYIDNTGTLQQGTPNVSQAAALIPGTSAYGAGWAYVPQNATGLYINQAAWIAAGSPAAKGYLMPRSLASGSSAGGTLPVSNAIVAAATGTSQATMQAGNNIGTPANLVDIMNAKYATGVTADVTVGGQSMAAQRIVPALVSPAAGQASVNDAFRAYVTSNIMTSLSGYTTGGSTAGLQIAPLGQSVLVFYNSLWRTIAQGAPVQTPTGASGAAALYRLYYDVNTQGVFLSLDSANYSATANQILLCKVVWDGAAWRLGYTDVDWTPIFPTLSGGLAQQIRGAGSFGSGASIVSGGVVRIAGTTDISLVFPVAMRYRIMATVELSSNTANAFYTFQFIVDGTVGGMTYYLTLGQTAGLTTTYTFFYELPTVGAGVGLLPAAVHTFGIAAASGNAAWTGSTVGVNLAVEAFR